MPIARPGCGAPTLPDLRRAGRAARRAIPCFLLVLWAICLPLQVGAEPARDYRLGVTAASKGEYKAAIDLWLPLALAGQANAQYAIGFLHEFGQGTPQDFRKAAHWYRRAASQKHFWACFNLGQLLAKGKGVAKNKMEAKMWLNLAAEVAGAGGKYDVGMLYAGLDNDFRDPTLAMRWMREAAELGLPKAQHRLGLWHENGLIVNRDEKAAVRLVTKAANNGFAPAKMTLGKWYSTGLIGPVDRVEAHKWYSRAAAQGHKYAEHLLNELTEEMTKAEIARAVRAAQAIDGTKIGKP
ncbi:MAG: tetratricopeptide repeat protein [Alphaproteobacteria bacterium]|nr:tetratricopeptide repeat protein [Alphaproteobacteria bacterium]